MNNKVITSKQIFQYGDQKLEYTLVKSKRRKTSELMVDENQIMLRIPSNKPLADAEKLINSKIKWIIKKQKEYKEEAPEITRPTFREGFSLPYLGKNYETCIMNDRNNDGDKIEFQDKFVIILGKTGSYNKQNRVRSLYEDWLYDKARNIFDEKIKHFSSVVGVTPKKLVLKKLKNRWGSLAKNKTMNLNLNLIKAPEDVIDYIIIHELCHFKIKGHSHKFWTYVHNFVPDYEDQINWLAINGSNMLE